MEKCLSNVLMFFSHVCKRELLFVRLEMSLLKQGIKETGGSEWWLGDEERVCDITTRGTHIIKTIKVSFAISNIINT